RVVEVQGRSLSPVLCAVVWTLLSCGILLSFLFLVFTVRYKNNRIVKMSSPNLNMLTLLGSVLTYSSGFLFAIEDRSHGRAAGSKVVMQAWVWTLCIGSSLVFGPILGKTWRLYRVFTQRLPDRRVIIRDIRLMGLVTLLVLVDVLILSVWSLTDPVKCSRSVSAVVKVVEFDVHYSLSQMDSCSSQYSDLWVLLLCALKASLLVYGTYLAGLTSSVSLPPVNQSLTIMTATCLVTASTALAIPVSLYLHSWPNLIYGMFSGTIFICSTAVNCLIFVPQLTQWRRFEEDVNPHPSHMAKYFSSKSLRSSENDIYYLLGEYDSMKRLISE
ncbi:G-protein coupled receptor, partial [Clarias magur]